MQHTVLQRAVAHVEARRHQQPQQFRPCLQPADPQAWGDHLGEGAGGDHEVALSQRRQRRPQLGTEVQLVVRGVLQHQHPMARGDLQQLAAARHRHGDAGRVVEGRRCVDQLGGGAGGGEPLQRVVELVDAHALGVHGYSNQPRTVAAEGTQRPGKGRHLGDHHVAGIEQCRDRQVDGAGGAVGKHEMLGVDGRALVAGEEPRHLLAQRLIAVRPAIGKRGSPQRRARVGRGSRVARAVSRDPAAGSRSGAAPAKPQRTSHRRQQPGARQGGIVGDAAGQRDRRHRGVGLAAGEPPVGRRSCVQRLYPPRHQSIQVTLGPPLRQLSSVATHGCQCTRTLPHPSPLSAVLQRR